MKHAERVRLVRDRHRAQPPPPPPDPASAAQDTARLGGRDAGQLVERVEHARALADRDAVFSALVDAFIGLAPGAVAERRELLHLALPHLDGQRQRFLAEHVPAGLDPRTATPEAPLSVLTMGTTGTVPLILRSPSALREEALGGSARPETPSADPPGAAPTAPVAEADRRPRRVRAWLIGAAAAVVVLISVAVVLQNRDSDRPTPDARTASGPSTLAPTTAASSVPLPPTTTRPSEVTTRPDPAVTAPSTDGPAIDVEEWDDPADALASLAEEHRAEVEELVGSWVPQIDSKKPGAQLGGRRWDDRMILDAYTSWRDAFPDTLLLRSDEFSSFAPGFWVMVVAEPFDEPHDALQWCTANDFTPVDCYAQLLTHDDARRPAWMFRD